MWYLELRQKVFTMRVVGHWNGLNGEAVTAPSVALFKARLNRAWSTSLECCDSM